MPNNQTKQTIINQLTAMPVLPQRMILNDLNSPSVIGINYVSQPTYALPQRAALNLALTNQRAANGVGSKR
jgi:hypothetical protein